MRASNSSRVVIAVRSIALSYPTESPYTKRHDEILATLITDVFFDVAIESVLQLLTSKTFHRQSNTTDDNAPP